MPKVSIIIPVYNGARWLAQTIQSALDQTWREREIVVVDDGSTDNSAEIARRFATAGVALVHQPNRGASAARNTGLRSASGEFIQFLDADDLLAPDKIALQMAVLDGHRTRLAACPWGVFHDDVTAAIFTLEPSWQSLPPIDWLVEVWSKGSMMQPGAWLSPRSILETAGPWDETLSLDDDGEYFARAVLASNGVDFVPNAQCFYRRHDGVHLSAARGEKARRSSFVSTTSKAKHLLAREDSARTRRACATNFARYAWENYPEGGKYVREAILRWKELDPHVRLPRGSGKEAALARYFGWRLARRLQKAFRAFR